MIGPEKNILDLEDPHAHCLFPDAAAETAPMVMSRNPSSALGGDADVARYVVADAAPPERRRSPR